MRACEIRSERQMCECLVVVVEHRADFINSSDTVVIFCAKSKTLEGSESRYADCVEVPSSEKEKERCKRAKASW